MRLAPRSIFARPSRCPRPQTRSYAEGDAQDTPKKKHDYIPNETIFSGIQPTGIPHLGNYLGALRQWKHFQDQKVDAKKPRRHKLHFSVVDLHALTHDQSREERSQLCRESAASLLAIGLKPELSNIFMQSDVPAHSELMWILSTIASTGYLSRMTQWKSKLDIPEDATLFDEAARAKLKLGLFSYPVLQAADILLYKTTLVPVGEDQAQHIEFTRRLAQSFNHHFTQPGEKPIFVLPRAKISPARRVMSLKEPKLKMSKSHADPKSRILITDSPEDIHAKIKVALTDSEQGISYEPERRPGVSNLLEILKYVTNNPDRCENMAKEFENTTMRGFKELVSTQIVRSLDGIRDRFMEITDPSNSYLRDAIAQGTHRARARAGNTLSEVRDALGTHHNFMVSVKNADVKTVAQTPTQPVVNGTGGNAVDLTKNASSTVAE